MKTLILFSTAESILGHWQSALKEHYALQSYAGAEKLLDALADDSGGTILFHADSSASPQEALRTLMTCSPGLKVFVLSDVPSFHEGEALLTTGIRGYGNARIHPAALLQALQIIEGGSHWFYPDFMQHLVLAVTQRSDAADSSLLARLSEREQEAALMVADGLQNREIAQKMGITERTVKAHLSAIFTKLGVKDRVGLALLLRGR